MTKYNLNHSETGFTLVELIVSVTITAIIMVGVSAFFASSFHNIFVTQEKLDESQGQFATNEIIRDKLTGIEEIIVNDATNIVVRNNTNNGDLPFTYIGDDGGKLVFKDFFVFNGMVASEESKDFADNAGGITKVGTNYYVVLPLENKIIICTLASSCTGEITGDFDHPTDITTDGTDLFVSDSGNNRVIKMTTGGATLFETMADGLNFPTGLAFSNNYLYVSDTYNNRVVRLNDGLGASFYPLDTSGLSIAGDGTDDTCDNTAKLCKLNFPTGLAVSGDGKSLYISDTGSGRILKITDPDSDLTSQEIGFNIPSVQKISKIDFTFPAGTTTSAITANDNPIHPGIWGNSGSKLSLYLSVPLVNGNPTEQDCSGTEGETCPIYFRRFTVNVNNEIFSANDPISIDSDPYTVDQAPAYPSVNVTPYDSNTTGYPPGTMVTIDSDYDGDKVFDFNLSTSSISSGFNLITTEIYDESDAVTVTETQILRVGDGTIGTAEDTIEVYPDETTTYDYSTGLGWDGVLQIANEASYDTNDFPDFDYESSFGLNDLQFSQPNSNILQMDIETVNGDTYVINASLN